jgi:CheY-like chemotaxis protein/nitrogen-specific signal transduction histidine kinase
MEAMSKMKKQGHLKNEETTIYTKDGSPINVLFFAEIVEIDGRKCNYIAAIDITEYKSIEKRLRLSQRLEAIGTLAGGIAHDFNNILYPIIGFAEMSIKELPEEHSVRENLEDILQGAIRAKNLVKQILLFSRQDKKETLKLLRSAIPTNIHFNIDLYKRQDFVFADPAEINEILVNICTNAYHAMEECGGVLTVKLQRKIPEPDLHLSKGEYCCLQIEDTGVGMSSETIGSIFDPYFTTQSRGKRTGLGLSVVHGIVKNYGGDIKVESEQGKGSVFSIYLPVVSDEATDREQTEPSGNVTGQEKILVVDDEKDIVKLVSRMLSKHGFIVTGATSSEEALKLFSANPADFDLVISDMAMPRMTGLDLSKELLELRPDIPIIICSGYGSRLDDEAVKKIGIKSYLKKPIFKNDLINKVRSVLDQSKKGA